MQPLERRRLLLAGATGLLAGLPGCNGDGADEDPTERGPLAVDEFAFAAREPEAYGEYEEQSDATYEPGDRVWLYVSLDGLAAEPIDGGVQIDLEHTLRIQTPDDETWLDETQTFDTELGREHLDRFYLKTPIDVPANASTGQYDVAASFTDNVSETSAEATGTFTIAE